MERLLKPYMGFKITKCSTNGDVKWIAQNESGYMYESRKSLNDLKERIYLDNQAKKLGKFLGKKLGLRRF